ncbi:hypothetical protein QT381_00610 [Galbitalea sp. SE-J8]|uniref:hypothetical protein n=1 Tax=Galbitalea sp. SE-J8 TaxID=3054952 RepID=UPI00259C8057|nr:hypothetical protein [Galbitalea sp. SE-J8]MDM4761509.1 hypothetical protein [Galbitalea sp. SE-J8]
MTNTTERDSGAAPSSRPWTAWRPGSSSLRGWHWQRLVTALVALVAAAVLGLVIGALVGGEFGWSLASAAVTAVVGLVAVVLLRRSAPRGVLAVTGRDICWGLLLGVALPFVGGALVVAAGQADPWPAYDALSPRWLIVGIALPIGVALLQQVFLDGALLVAVFAVVRRWGAWAWLAKTAAVLLSTAASVGLALFASAGVLRMPVLLVVVLGLGSAALVVVTSRLWGAVVLGVVFTGVWVLLSVAGAL